MRNTKATMTLRIKERTLYVAKHDGDTIEVLRPNGETRFTIEITQNGLEIRTHNLPMSVRPRGDYSILVREDGRSPQ